MSRWFHYLGIVCLIVCFLMIVGYLILLGMESISFGDRLTGPGYFALLIGSALCGLVLIGISNYLDRESPVDSDTLADDQSTP